MPDIVQTLVNSLNQRSRLPYETKDLFIEAAGEVMGKAMYQAYVNSRFIPSPILAYCAKLQICHLCGKDLSTTRALNAGRKDGVTLLRCHGECPPKRAQEPEQAPQQGDAPPIRVTVVHPHRQKPRQSRPIEEPESASAPSQEMLAAEIRALWEKDLK